MTCGQSSGCTGECKIAPFKCPNYVRLDVENYHAADLAWQLVDRDRNIWESPTGALRRWPPGVAPGFAVLKA